MCDCVNIQFGRFGIKEQNRTSVLACYGKKQKIANCILDELQDLWKQGILTNASCCGHNKKNGGIVVDESFIRQMKLMGYVKSSEFHRYTFQEILNLNTDEMNKFNEGGKGLFYPKSIPITNKFN